jgi:general stress protein 26
MAPIRLSLAGPLRGKKREGFLRKAEHIHLASAVGEGGIYVSAMFFIHRDGTIYVPFDQASKHVENFADPKHRISACIDEGDTLATVHGVNFNGGQAKLVEDKELLAELEEAILDKHFYEGHPHLEQYVNFGRYHGRTWYALEWESVFGWDLRELALPGSLEARRLPDHVLESNGNA